MESVRHTHQNGTSRRWPKAVRPAHYHDDEAKRFERTVWVVRHALDLVFPPQVIGDGRNRVTLPVGTSLDATGKGQAVGGALPCKGQ